MTINVIATGSSGNLYEIIDNEGNSMLIEAGVPVATYMKYREGKKKPEMCIISHSHSDHYAHANEFRNMMPTYCKEARVQSENFKAMGFTMVHGDGISYSYLIKVLTEDKFLFFGTDFEYSDDYEILFHHLKAYNVSNYLIECNYNDFLYHLAKDEQRMGCDRHMSDNDVIRFIRKVQPVNPKLILIHGSSRLCSDSYTKKYIGSKLLTATVAVATGAKSGQKNLFKL